VRSVTVVPGRTTVTLTPDGPSSSSRLLVIAATAMLHAAPTSDPDCRGAQPADVHDASQALRDKVRRDRAAQRR
jgi:hypothetical protein